jgi:fructose-specific component phosphotransferase system IIB-like protein
VACFFAVIRIAAADPAAEVIDPPEEAHPVTVPPSTLPPTWDLDGTYVWLGPVGAASHIDARWDSTFGAEAAVVAVHERESLGLVGANLGASRWTARGGGRVWVDGLVGTHLLDHMMGISLGPILELSDLAHPRPGASIGVWGFAGITPFARLGAVANLGMFAEVGLHISLPVLRR